MPTLVHEVPALSHSLQSPTESRRTYPIVQMEQFGDATTDHHVSGQCSQAEAPDSERLPALQAVQSSMESWKLARLPLSLRYVPAGQAVQLVDPAVDTSPEVQMLQVTPPLLAWYLPATQRVQPWPPLM